MAWMAAGHPENIKKIMDIFPEEDGRRPSYHAIGTWISKYDWQGRAEIIDSKAIEVATESIINIKAEIMRQQFQDSVLIAQKALQHLASGTFDSSASAVSAYFRATEEQRRAVGISEIIEKMLKMNDDELEKEILDRIRRATEAGQIIEGEINGEEDEESD